MHIIAKRMIIEARERYYHSASALAAWYAIVEKNSFNNFAELKKVFNSVDKVDHLYVFDIGGNKLRLIASIHFNRQKLYIRHILTHEEYDRGAWRTQYEKRYH